MDNHWGARAEEIAFAFAEKEKAPFSFYQIGTNLSFALGEQFFRISRPSNKEAVGRSWLISQRLQEIDPGLTPRPLWRQEIKSLDIWVYEFFSDATTPDNWQELDQARRRSQKALAQLDEDVLHGLKRWPGPLRSFKMYMESLSSKAPEPLVEDLQERANSLSEEVRNGKWSEEEVIIHGDFSASNCLQLPGENIMVIDWDCVQRGPWWADRLKLWDRGLENQEAVSDEYSEWVQASLLARDAFEAYARYCLRS